ncbi:MAG TPA: pantoate--beta-alanine ligase [Beijerinckiaceae bacterium]|nr:pantoate--beta-alanine ligase [Beijerinckiaceae bacterium]
MSAPHLAFSTAELRAQVARWRQAGDSVALAPTMGALHEGHLSLVRIAQKRASKTIVSVFVNPTQFAPGEDFAAYPRTFESDLEKLSAVGADLIFRPVVEEVYPPGFATSVAVGGPAAAGLEDKFRPSHFAGVATIVTKLLLLARPDVAVFGEKDYQQLAVIRRLVCDLDIESEIVGAPIFREPDGLAMSSRNVYLTHVERESAPVLHRELKRAAALIMDAGDIGHAMAQARQTIAKAGFALDYFELRNAETLAPIDDATKEGRLLVAARIGRTRLIDNLALTLKDRR